MESVSVPIRAEIAPLEPKDREARERFVSIEDFSFFYGKKPVLQNLNLAIPREKVTAFIGPSGCGKSTLLRCINRMNDLVDEARHEGTIKIGGQSIYASSMEPTALRRRVGMVFQRSNPFPKSIYENVVYGLRVNGVRKKSLLDETAERCLRDAALWDEVKHRLHENALRLSGGEMQRLCIARAIATQPEILLMDEPCGALDPIATGRIEELITQLKQKFTVIIVTHNMQQAGRISDETAFFYGGRLIEHRPTEDIFMNPREAQTEDYVSGRFG